MALLEMEVESSSARRGDTVTRLEECVRTLEGCGGSGGARGDGDEVSG